MPPRSPKPPQNLTLEARDGHALAATLWPRDDAPARLLVAGATGVPQGFYRRFADQAQGRGFEVMTLDYRGIGRSRPPGRSLRGFQASFLDWAELDLAAAVDALHEPGRPLFLVGHSFGGHALGLLPNHDKIDRAYLCGTGAGWHGWMPRPERWRVQLMWSLIGPLVTRWAGYLPWQRMGMGEDLPLGVYAQWRHWCQFPHYFFDDPEQTQMAARFAAVRTPSIAANALDDLWAPPRSRDAFMQHYRGSPWQARDLDPQSLGLKALGHMGYFRAPSAPLWDDMFAWFAQHPHTPASDATPATVAPRAPLAQQPHAEA